MMEFSSEFPSQHHLKNSRVLSLLSIRVLSYFIYLISTLFIGQFVFYFHTPPMVSAFFYGTLMHPKILKRVIGNDGTYVQISPALLLDYTRHKVNGVDYPGIVPYSRSRAMFSGDLEPEERSVRGSLVVGLSDEDMRLLDIFEGDEYTRELVLVHTLGPLVALDDVEVTRMVPKDPPPAPAPNEQKSPLEVNTYVWCRPLSTLQPKLWTFEEFVQESAWKWIGAGSQDNRDYREVDRRRMMNGTIVRTEA